MQIGNLSITEGAALAPMAGLTDASLRALAAEYGASYTISEMVSAKALTFGDRKSRELCMHGGGTMPYGIQLFGCEPAILAAAAKLILPFHPDFIDINMGCPAPKITGGGNGSALLKNPKLAGECAAAVVKAVDIPVTVKMRIGWDDDTITGAETAKRCEDAGVAAIAVHGRTRQQMYTPPISLSHIAEVVKAVKIPVIGNGDITTAADAKAMIDETGCAMVMVGRGALGNLWLFQEIRALLHGEPAPAAPTLRERLQLLKRQVRMMCDEKGESRALREARTHATHYLKGVRGAAKFRNETSALTYYTDLEALCERVLRENQGK